MTENKEKLVPTLRDYISVRKRLAEANEVKGSNDAGAEPTGQRRTPSDVQMDESASASAEVTQQGTPATSTPPDAASSRELLTKVASLSDEMVRACNEKVNVARFAYDLVR